MIRRWCAFWRNLVSKGQVEQELDDELHAYLELVAHEKVLAGVPAETALQDARRDLGNIEVTKESVRDMRTGIYLDTLIQDLRYAIRSLSKSPSFLVMSALTLALGIGANSAIFSVVNGVLLSPLPFDHPERLVALFEKDVVDDNSSYNPVAPASFLDWQKQSTTLEQIAAVSLTSFNASTESKEANPKRVDGCGSSANLFNALGVTPILGRAFSIGEDRPGGTPVAVISYGLWHGMFGGSSSILSKRLRLNGTLFSIIGVMPEGFGYPSRDVQVWIPLQQHLSPIVLKAHDNHVLSATIGRLRRNVSVEEARTEIDSIVKHYKHEHPAEVMGKGANVVPLGAFTLHDIRTSLLLLFAAVTCVLLIACVNVANLLLTRSLGRKREIAIRSAIGAVRARIIRQLLVESALLSSIGTGLGLLLAYSLVGYLTVNLPGAAWLPQLANLHVDVRVFLFSIGLAIATALLAGFYPAHQVSRVDLADNLKDANRTSTSGRQQNFFRDVLVTSEVALCLVLLVAAGLLMRSFEQLLSKNLGLRTRNTSVLRVSLPDSRYHERKQVSIFLKDLEEKLKNLPGVAAIGFSSCPIVSGPGYCPDTVFQIEGHPPQTGHLTDAEYRQVSPDFFRAAGIPLLDGRRFTARDGIGLDDSHPHAGQVIVNREFARRFFPSESALGKRLDLYWFVGNNTKQSSLKYEIVGVVGNSLQRPDAPAEPIFYLPIFDGDQTDINVILHTTNVDAGVLAQAQQSVHQIDSDLAVFGVQTISSLVEESVRGRRYMTLLFEIFGSLAILLAVVGLYGVVSGGVLQRTNEIAIRMAVGASRREVLAMVLARGLRPVITGVLIGLPAAVVAVRFLRSQLFETSPSDPLTLIVIPLMLLFIASLASFAPAFRASRMDPMVSLRTE